MADKKITELTILSDIAQNDRLVIVDDPDGTPITKQITVSKFFGNVNFITDSTTRGLSLIKSQITANANADSATANTVVAGDFIVTSTAASSNTEYQYGLRVTSGLSTNTAKITKQHAAAKFILDVSSNAAANVIANTYSVVFQVSNTAGRNANVQAFIGIGDTAANSTTAQTLYLMDVGLNGTANVSANVSVNSNSLVMLTTSQFSGSQANSTPTHKIKVRINGADYWLLASNTHQ